MKPKHSNYGFYCKLCGKFSYFGYGDNQVANKEDSPICARCGKKYPYLLKEEKLK